VPQHEAFEDREARRKGGEGFPTSLIGSVPEMAHKANRSDCGKRRAPTRENDRANWREPCKLTP